MAGAGYKLFNTGDVLTAAQVNTYLQEQAVMRFATTAARTTALSSVLAEGMVSYIDATDSLEFYNGSAWVAVNTTAGDITGITTDATSGLTGGVTSGTANLKFNTTAKGGLLVGTGSGTVTELTVGSNNTVLTADSSTASGLKWAAASSGGMTLISTTTLSGASVTLSSIAQTYNQLKIYIWGVSNNTADGKLTFKPNNGTNYRWSGTDYNAVYSATGSTLQTSANISRTNVDNGFVFTIDNYTSAGYTTVFHLDGYYFDGGNPRGINIAGSGSDGPISSFVLANTGGTFASGTMQLYGVK